MRTQHAQVCVAEGFYAEKEIATENKLDTLFQNNMKQRVSTTDDGILVVYFKTTTTWNNGKQRLTTTFLSLISALRVKAVL